MYVLETKASFYYIYFAARGKRCKGVLGKQRMYNSYSFLSSALNGLSGQHGLRHAPTALYSGKYPRYPLDKRLGVPRTTLDAEARKKIPLTLLGIEPWSFSQ
jgi:hypothetical protein